MGDSPGVSDAPVISKTQFAICVPLTPVVLVVIPQFKRHVPLVVEASVTKDPVVIRVDPPINREIVKLVAVTGVE
jgi:hypothetical protein